MLWLILACGSPELDLPMWFADHDGDGYGDAANSAQSEVPPAGMVQDGTDCDDSDPAVYPGADERCDGRDDDCDTMIDENAIDAPTWYLDADNDGYGAALDAVVACEPPAGRVEEGGDCDDASGAIHPGATEDDCADPTDYDCDGVTLYADEDGDGWPACEDCDDTNAAANPDEVELCNEFDDDCDGLVDEDDAQDRIYWYADADGDGYGDANDATSGCEGPSGSVADGADCDDSDPTINPGLEDIPCDGIDNDCDGFDLRCKPRGNIDVSDAEIIILGQNEESYLGEMSELGGDMDGDGIPELILGSHTMNDYRGAVYVIEAAPPGKSVVDDIASVIKGVDVGDAIGGQNFDSSFVGKLLGGTYDDLGIPGYGDTIYIFGGPLTADSDLGDADLRIGVGADTWSIGHQVGSADWSGDGQSDLLVSTSGTTYLSGDGWRISTGAVWGFLGPVSVDLDTDDADLKIDHRGEDTWFGRILCASDLDGDGQDDLAVAAPCLMGDCDPSIEGGAVYIFHGPLSGSLQAIDEEGGSLEDASARWLGGGHNDSSAGYAMTCGGDVDGDGRSDLLIGAPDTAADSLGGAAALVDGSLAGERSLTDATWRVEGSSTDEWVGAHLTSDSDLDGDGFADVVVTRNYDSDRTGVSDLFYGGALSGIAAPADADASYWGHSAGDSSGWLAGGADLDGDGFDDLLSSAIGEDTGGDNAGAAYILFGGGWVP